MHWIDAIRTRREANPGDIWDDPVFKEAPVTSRKLAGRGSEKPAPTDEPVDPRIAEAIRLRQTSLLVRYVAIVRAH